MVYITPFLGAAVLLSGFVSALPRPEDSAVGGEIPVSAPNGVPQSDTIDLSSSKTSSADVAKKTDDSSSYGGYDSSKKDDNKYDNNYSSSEDNKYSTEESKYSSTEESKYSSTSEYNQYSTTESKMMESSSMMMESSSTSSAYYSMPTYGSGNSNWGGYEDCVQQCISSHGAPPATYYPPTETQKSEESSSGSKGSGATHTVIVAPTQGVLRYMPFAVTNASVGDTIEFRWGAGPHTVTSSTSLEPCNKSVSEPLFASGQQNKSFVFTQVVNDTNPTFYYCAIPTHCQKGMFGIINPQTDLSGSDSVGGKMQDLMAANNDLKMYAAITSNNTEGKAGATWGSNFSLKDMPTWSHDLVAENVLYTRNLLAMNSEIVKADGSVDLGNMGTTPLMIPQDVGATLNAVSGTTGAASGTDSNQANSSPATQPTNSAPAATETKAGNGAVSVASPKVMVALVAVAAAFFAL